MLNDDGMKRREQKRQQQQQQNVLKMFKRNKQQQINKLQQRKQYRYDDNINSNSNNYSLRCLTLHFKWLRALFLLQLLLVVVVIIVTFGVLRLCAVYQVVVCVSVFISLNNTSL